MSGAAAAVLVYTLANGGDYASTRYLQARGGREVWLPAQSPAGLVAWEAGGAAAMAWGDLKLQHAGHPGWARALRIGVIVFKGWVIAHNLKGARR